MKQTPQNLIYKLTLQQNFTFAEKGIADYIVRNTNEAMKLDIAELAKETSSSNATIIRMCKKLGLSGYREFRIHLIEEESSRTEEIFVDFNIPFGENISSTQLAENMAKLMKTTVDLCRQKINMNVIEDAARLLYGSNHTFIYARGDSLSSSQSFSNRMLKIGKFLNVTSMMGEERIFSRNAKPGDCAVILTYSAAFDDFVENARILKENGVPIITITANRHSELTTLSDFVIFIPEMEKKGHRMGTFYSQLALEYILNVLCGVIYSFHYKENSSILVGMF